MNKRKKYILVFLVGVFIISITYNINQLNKLINYKKELKAVISENIQNIAGLSGDIEDSNYLEQYASIITAQNAYIALSENKGVDSNEWSFSLPGMINEIKQVMLLDKENFKEKFKETDVSSLLFKISNNLEDKDSINKVYKIFNS